LLEASFTQDLLTRILKQKKKKHYFRRSWVPRAKLHEQNLFVGKLHEQNLFMGRLHEQILFVEPKTKKSSEKPKKRKKTKTKYFGRSWVPRASQSPRTSRNIVFLFFLVFSSFFWFSGSTNRICSWGLLHEQNLFVGKLHEQNLFMGRLHEQILFVGLHTTTRCA